MWCKRDWIVSPSNKSSSIFPLIHKSIFLSSAFRWSFTLDVLPGFWRRLGMTCIAVKAISLKGELFVHPFISLVVSVIYFFAAAPVGSMNKFFFQKTIRSYASWIFLDTSRRFRPPHLMFVYSSLTISLTFWHCCDSVVLWRSLTLSWPRSLSYRNQSIDLRSTGFYMITVSVMKEFAALELAGWLSVTIKSLVFLKQVRRCWFNPRYVKKLRTLQDAHRK